MLDKDLEIQNLT